MLYIEDLQEEFQRNKNFGFTIDDSIPLDLKVDVAYKGVQMISLSVQDSDKYELYEICNALARAYSEGEIYGRFAECMSI